MQLVFDVGNTNTVIGLFDAEGALVDHWRAATDPARTGDEWRVLLDNFLAQHVKSRPRQLSDVETVAIGSVVPAVTGSLQRMCGRLDINALTVTHETDTGMAIELDNPREIGPDRMANGVAAIEKGALPAIVVDMGTATTIDAVSAKGTYAGGVILPGLAISLEALFSRAAALRSVPVSVPKNVVGKSTELAVQSGATYGTAAEIDGLCERVKSEIGDARVYFTGGMSSVIAPLSKQCNVHDPWMTLRGFSLIARRLQNEMREQ